MDDIFIQRREDGVIGKRSQSIDNFIICIITTELSRLGFFSIRRYKRTHKMMTMTVNLKHIWPWDLINRVVNGDTHGSERKHNSGSLAAGFDLLRWHSMVVVFVSVQSLEHNFKSPLSNKTNKKWDFFFKGIVTF